MRRVGKNKKPSYQIVVIDSRKARDAEFIEKLGWYNALTDEFALDMERYNDWVSKGAIPTLRVLSLLKRKTQKMEVKNEGTD